MVTAAVILGFIITPFQVSGGSMEPSYSDGDLIFVNRTARSFRVGDVIVLTHPDPADGRVLVKRIHAVAGDTVDNSFGVQYYTVPEGSVFVVGDNINDSLDSRTFGSVPINLIIGRVL